MLRLAGESGVSGPVSCTSYLIGKCEAFLASHFHPTLKHLLLALLITPKPLTVQITTKLWKILKEMGIPDHLTCVLRNMYAGQEATVRNGHGTTDWFQIGKGVRQGYILSPCLFNLHAEYIMRNAGLDEAQAGIETAGRIINKLRYADDTGRK